MHFQTESVGEQSRQLRVVGECECIDKFDAQARSEFGGEHKRAVEYASVEFESVGKQSQLKVAGESTRTMEYGAQREQRGTWLWRPSSPRVRACAAGGGW